MNTLPPQHQDRQPGLEHKMNPRPESFMEDYKAAGKLEGKIALISGGDSGIGRAVCMAFAKEGASVAFIYLEEDEDAQVTADHIEEEGSRCIMIRGDITDPDFCREAAEKTVSELGGLNILVNNAAEQHVQEDITDIAPAQLRRTFETNVFGAFYLTQAAMPHLSKGDAIINTTSITAYRGHPELLDYSATKGALLAFTRSLAANLVEKGIRVNAVAPGPVWTPLIPSSFDKKEVQKFGEDSPMGRPGQPDEIAPSFVFLASADASYMTGQVLHPNGGTIING
jgi:NAD(P)-dependent dehydrogenase (short-subunit alcohol dehydrogenase family)